MQFLILDEREVWHRPAIKTAWARGYSARRILRGSEVQEAHRGAWGFIRPHAAPKILLKNHVDYDQMAVHLNMVQDPVQVAVYENKTAQWKRWHAWMPNTVRFDVYEQAMHFAYQWSEGEAIVSKADVGASSVNVRILRSRDQLLKHIDKLFKGDGIDVKHCSGGGASKETISKQKGYVLLQEFIPHQVTWRVNVVGRKMAAFRRFCYPDRPVAQTGNVEPVMEIDEEIVSLLEFSKRVFSDLGTRWCAIDVLKNPAGEWKLIETSLAWPWPSPGECNKAPFFDTKRVWAQMWDVLFDEIEAGAWTN